MSTTASSASREFWPWLGHNAWWLQLSINAVLVAGIFWAQPLWEGIVVLGLIVLMAWVQHHHDHSLCEKCIAGLPLDPQAEVARRGIWLRAAHFGEHRTRWRSVAISLLFWGGFAALVIFTSHAISGVIIVLMVGVISPLATITVQIHKRLQPWCPYCRDDGGGHQFSPDPTPSLTKELT